MSTRRFVTSLVYTRIQRIYTHTRWRLEGGRLGPDGVPHTALGIGGDLRSKEALLRLVKVQERLRQRRVGYDDLEVWRFGAVDRKHWARASL
jgi:hypothetical protein